MSLASAFLADLPQTSIRLGLDRVGAALASLGNPQGRYPAILVAGTNGKGSTSAFLASSLQAAGRKVGMSTSPHLTSFRERIRIDGEPIGEEALDRLVARLMEAHPPSRDPGHPDALTYFEVGVVLGFLAFAEAEVDVAVLEVGLGGRLDAANARGTKLLATVITGISLDHTDLLGDSLEAIAAEKGAICRQGIPLVIGPQPEAAREVLVAIAAAKGAPLIEVGSDPTLPDGWKPGLLGGFQVENAAVALATLQAVGGLSPEAVRRGISEARWPGRLEVVGNGPLLILDGAHNPAGARALAKAFPTLWPGVRPHIVFGMLGDKDRQGVMEALLPLAEAIHVCTPASPRAVPGHRLADEARRHVAEGIPIDVHSSVGRAIEAASLAAGPEGAVLICGSLYLVGEARALLVRGAPPG